MTIEFICKNQTDLVLLLLPLLLLFLLPFLELLIDFISDSIRMKPTSINLIEDGQRGYSSNKGGSPKCDSFKFIPSICETKYLR